LLGNSGTGKTHLAFAATKEATKQGVVVLFVMAQDLLEFSDKEGKKLLRDVDILAIDDFEEELIDAATIRFFHQIVNYRTADEKAIILTTTFSPDELRRKLGDRTTSRLFFSVRVVFFQNTPSYAMLQKKKSGHTDPGTQN
jgi:DNA replication protein DnaC